MAAFNVTSPPGASALASLDTSSESKSAKVISAIACITIGALVTFRGHDLEKPVVFILGYMMGTAAGRELLANHIAEEFDFHFKEAGVHFYLPGIAIGVVLGLFLVSLIDKLERLIAGIAAMLCAVMIRKTIKYTNPYLTHSHEAEVEIFLLLLVFVFGASYGGKYVAFALCFLESIIGSFVLTFGINLIIGFFRKPLIRADLVGAAHLAMKHKLDTVMEPGDQKFFFLTWGMLALLGGVVQIGPVSREWRKKNERDYAELTDF